MLYSMWVDLEEPSRCTPRDLFLATFTPDDCRRSLNPPISEWNLKKKHWLTAVLSCCTWQRKAWQICISKEVISPVSLTILMREYSEDVQRRMSPIWEWFTSWSLRNRTCVQSTDESEEETCAFHNNQSNLIYPNTSDLYLCKNTLTQLTKMHKWWRKTLETWKKVPQSSI